MSRPQCILALVAICLVHATLLFVYHWPQQKKLWGDEVKYRRAAEDLLASRPPDLEILWPPLYPRFLAALLWAGRGSILVVQAVQTLMLLAVALVLRDLGQRLMGRGPPADLLALTVLVYPPLVAFAHYLWPEILHLLLFVSALWILAARRRRPLWLVALGVLLGLALLAKNLLGPFVPALLLPVALAARGRQAGPREAGPRQRIVRPLLVVAALGATVAPTMIATHQRTGVSAAATSARFNLWVGLNDTSRQNLVDIQVGRELRRWRLSSPDYRQRGEILDRKLRTFVDERGGWRILRDQLGRQYFRLFDKESFLTDQLPGGAIARQGGGYRSPPPALAAVLRAASYSLYAAILVAAVAGVLLCPPGVRAPGVRAPGVRAPGVRKWLWLVLGFIAYNLAIFLWLHVKTRYRIQLLPAFFLCAGCALDGWRWRWRAAARGAPVDWPRPWAWAAAAVAACLLLFLAFGGPLLD